MCEHDPSLEKYLRQVPQAQPVAEAPQHHQADHIGGILEPMIGRAGSLINPPLAGATAQATVPQLRPIRALNSSGRLTVRACHGLASFQRSDATCYASKNERGVRADRTHGVTAPGQGPPSVLR